MNKTMGVIGGMGALATAIFYAIVTNAQDRQVEVEQDYLDMIIYSKTSIPDRTAYILGQSDADPTADIIAAAITLEQAGADFLAMPCVTAHYFYREVADLVGIPFINLLDEIAAHVESEGLKRVGLLATQGTLQSRILHTVLEDRGVEVLTPGETEQALLMDMIYSIKVGGHVTGRDFDNLEDALFARGAQSIILGCTELSLIKGEIVTERIDALSVLARAALKMKNEDPGSSLG